MKLFKGIHVYLFAAIILFSACGPSQIPNDSLKNVPGDISSVTAFNMNQLMLKADLGYIQSLDFYEDAVKEMKKEDPVIASFIESPATTGIDLTKNMYLVVDIDKESPNEKFIGFVFSVTDQSMFETMLTKTRLGEFQQGDNHSFISNSDNFLAWNNEFGVVGYASKHFDISQQATRFFDIDKTNSVANNKDLKKCLSKDYDIATWMNSNLLAQNEQIKMAAAMVGISNSSLQNNYIHSYLNFNEGDITGHSKHFFQKELTNDLKLFFKDGINKNLSKYIPAENLGMLMGAALDAKGIYQVVSEKVGGYVMANKALKEYGFNSKDIANAFGGDVVVAVYENEMGKDVPDGLIASTINDREIFDKFIDLAEQFEMLVKQKDNLYVINNAVLNNAINSNNKKAYLYIMDDLFFISAKPSIIETIQNGGYKSADQVDKSIYQTVGNNAFGSYVDFKNFKRLTGQLEHIPFTNMELDAGLKDSNMKVEMKDKSMNSLMTLFKLMNEIYLADQKVVNDQTI